MKKTQRRKLRFFRTPSNNERRRRGMAMIRHSGKRHDEKHRRNNMPF